jgi:GTP-binding protein YchF
VDIAGLVAGASKGEGLGNKFLANIREVDAVIHMLRCFDLNEIQNVNKTIDPIRDLEIVETEMMISDLESVEKRLSQKKNNNNDINKDTFDILEHVYESLKKGVRPDKLDEKFDKKLIKNLRILSTKPRILVCNVDEESVSLGNSYSQRIREKFKSDTVVIVSAEIEQQITELKDLEANEFMKDIGIKESGLDQIIKAGYKILNLTTYFTVGPEETHAWTIEKNCKAPDAAKVIHSDFKKGFIKAEVISYIDYIRYAGEVGARDHGKLKIEGKDYEVADGDVLHFRFNT